MLEINRYFDAMLQQSSYFHLQLEDPRRVLGMRREVLPGSRLPSLDWEIVLGRNHLARLLVQALAHLPYADCQEYSLKIFKLKGTEMSAGVSRLLAVLCKADGGESPREPFAADFFGSALSYGRYR